MLSFLCKPTKIRSSTKIQKRKFAYQSQKEKINTTIKEIQHEIIDSVKDKDFTNNNIIIPSISSVDKLWDLNRLHHIDLLSNEQINDVEELNLLYARRFPSFDKKLSNDELNKLLDLLLKDYNIQVNQQTAYDNAMILLNESSCDVDKLKDLKVLCEYNPQLRTQNLYTSLLIANIMVKLDDFDKEQFSNLLVPVVSNYFIFENIDNQVITKAYSNCMTKFRKYNDIIGKIILISVGTIGFISVAGVLLCGALVAFIMHVLNSMY